MATGDMILYYLSNGEKAPIGPHVAQCMSSAYRNVSDKEVINYVRKMHHCNPIKIERIPREEI